MSRPGTYLRALALAGVALGLTCALRSTSLADGEQFVVIVHPENPAEEIDRDFLRNAYLKKSTEWGDGTTIRPVDLTTSYSAREQFTRQVIRKTPAQLKSYWNQRIFSGKGVPPPEAGSTADLIAYVLSEEGAVGYLPANVDPGDAKVIRVD